MADKKIWAFFLQLSNHMWDDEDCELPVGWYLPPTRFEAENKTDLAVWDRTVQFIAQRGYNMLVIDVGDGIRYDSHPEISAPDAWSKEFLKKKLDELRALGIASYTDPKGGYFVSLDVLPGTARRVFFLMKEAGVTLTQVGATFPYGVDPKDTNLRLAPTYATLEELELGMSILVLAVKIAALESMV